jgi:uncharacterized membrane protein YphA (DoxX/SURF4 family)/thiol-disulfide isomerase/thioredoxin
MNAIKKFGPWTIRIIISFVFFLSAIAKLYPKPSYALTYFEVHQLEPMGISIEIAHYLSRFLIGVEFAIGILLLLPFHIKRIIIPATIFMLGVFIIELTYEMIKSGNQGNCGCFGTLIEMTPLEALLKNVASIGLLVAFYFLDETKEKLSLNLSSRAQLSGITNIILFSVFGVFLAAPIRREQHVASVPVIQEQIEADTVIEITKDSSGKVLTIKKLEDTTRVKEELSPKPVKSGYENLFPNINKGKKILCFFAPGCDHCRATAKELTQLKKSLKDFPPIQIVFMDEEPELIPDFFQFAGAKYSYTVMDIIKFWKVLGKGKDVPGVVYLWNGNIQKFYQGIENQKFNAGDCKILVQKPFK